jgi:hypothetical protein
MVDAVFVNGLKNISGFRQTLRKRLGRKDVFAPSAARQKNTRAA